MAKLKYRFTNDVLFKWLFSRNQQLLKRLIALMLSIEHSSIREFVITNPEILPETLGEKLCRLDINMTVDGRKVDLEIQVSDCMGNFPERSLYYWAREYSSALYEGEDYIDAPQAVIIGILGYKQFPCAEYYSEYQALEITRYTQLTDRLCLKYYELPKLPEITDTQDELKLWLALFNAKTEEDLRKIESMGVPIMDQAIGAYRTATSEDEFKRLERMRFEASLEEASALGHARRKGEEKANKKWKKVIAEKDKALADKDKALADMCATIADLGADIEMLRKQVAELQNKQ